MNFLNTGIPLGQYWGINVRLHFTFLFYAFWQAQNFGNLAFGLAFVAGLYFCILLHEFGHALAARWCDGEANDILLWPLGGLAFCRPAFHPTAHLITTVAGPFVTLVLWLMFWGLSFVLETAFDHGVNIPQFIYWFVAEMRSLNLWLLLFNVCVPAFPMDGGRMLRDTLWHWMSAEKATKIAIGISQLIAIVAVSWAVAVLISPDSLPPLPYNVSPIWAIVLALFILPQTMQEKQIVGFEARGTYQFSIRERLRRGKRQRSFRQAIKGRVAEESSQPFHRCATCGRTEDDGLEFRVCPECSHGEEYCTEHLETHPHT